MYSAKLQSAMEYLMTYGWSILLIAIVLVALNTVGVFNSATFAPKASPGSCVVSRPYGAGSTSNLNLVGTCQNQLPKYVAKFNGNAYVQFPAKATLSGLTSWTLSLWMYQNSAGQHDVYTEGTPSIDFALNPGTNQLQIDVCSAGCWTDYFITANQLAANQWQFLTLTLSNATATTGTFTLYINGQLQGTSGGRLCCGGGTTLLGGEIDGGTGTPVTTQYNGYMSNLQLYNTALDPNTIESLYLQGIGSGPINLRNLTVWYPLNGDTNDYSGNARNGMSTNVIFWSSWTSGYTIP